jgi:signal transduction histidine kinase
MDESSSLGRALDEVGSQLEPVDDSDADFYARLAAALARVARARAGVLLRLESGGFHVVAESKPVESARLRRVIAACRRARTRPAPGPPPGSCADMLLAWWRSGDVDVGAVAVLDSTTDGFSEADREALDVAAAAAAVVWRQRKFVQGLLAKGNEEAQRVRSLADRALELEEMKRRILNLAAHELRGPVTVIRGYLEMLDDGSIDERALRRVLPILNGKAAQMDALVRQMLEVARLDEGRLELRREIVDLGAICRQTVDVAGLIAPPGISVFLERPPNAIEVEGDADRLATIIANLVDNAIKYSPDGGVVHCRAGVKDHRAFVEVRDRGLGIAEENLGDLFTRFGRIVTPENSHIPGTGLGLYLSRDLALMHGGDITVSSRPGQGSVFTLWLPLAPGSESA